MNIKLPFKYIDIQSNQFASMENEIRDVDKPWGSRAAIENVEKQCSVLPTSVFISSRYVFTLITSAMFSFAINDIYNGEVGNQVGGVIIPIIAFSLPILFVIALFLSELHEKKNNDNDTEDQVGDIEISEMNKVMKINSVNDVRNPVNQSM